jgi:hypothetical protein
MMDEEEDAHRGICHWCGRWRLLHFCEACGHWICAAPWCVAKSVAEALRG